MILAFRLLYAVQLRGGIVSHVTGNTLCRFWRGLGLDTRPRNSN